MTHPISSGRLILSDPDAMRLAAAGDRGALDKLGMKVEDEGTKGKLYNRR